MDGEQNHPLEKMLPSWGSCSFSCCVGSFSLFYVWVMSISVFLLTKCPAPVWMSSGILWPFYHSKLYKLVCMLSEFIKDIVSAGGHVFVFLLWRIFTGLSYKRWPAQNSCFSALGLILNWFLCLCVCNHEPPQLHNCNLLTDITCALLNFKKLGVHSHVWWLPPGLFIHNITTMFQEHTLALSTCAKHDNLMLHY